MIRTLLISALFVGWASIINAQPPAGYYNSAQGLAGTALQSALHDIIDGHSAQDYSTLHTHFETTDSRTNLTVWDMYSDVPGGIPPYVYNFIAADRCGNYSQEGDCYNREHSFPKSWFGGSVAPMYSDLFEVYPTDGYVNSYRGNLPYGEVGSASWTSLNGSKRGMSNVTGYIGEVFEPIDAYKGDFARTYFYMATRYYGEDAAWPGSPMVNGAQPYPWAINMLLQWHTLDTVSAKEIERNNDVYAIQGNRNPFIDNAAYAQSIWGIPSSILNNFSGSAWVVFPIPAKNYLYIENARYGVQNVYYTLTDLYGRTLLEGINKNDKLKISTEGLPTGLYILSLEQKGKVPYSIKVSKQ